MYDESVELISGVPTIVWILVITFAFSGGGLTMGTIAGALTFTSWIWPATTARIFVLSIISSALFLKSLIFHSSNIEILFIK